MNDKLIEQLERTRAGYAGELAWHQFLSDAYTGQGGFAGAVEQPGYGYYGRASEVYAENAIGRSLYGSGKSGSYLVRYPREDDAKFQARIAVAHYPNYIEPIVDLRNSHLLRKAFTQHEEPKELAEWREDVDGEGTHFNQLRADVALCAALWGWLPTIVDAPPVEEGLTVAQVREAGLERPSVTLLAPANLLEWSHDGQRWRWAKIRVDRTEVDDWTAEPAVVSRYTIWYPTEAIVYEVAERKSGKEIIFSTRYAHPFGQVPIAIARHKSMPVDPRAGRDVVRGIPMLGQASVEARRLFNLHSELDEHVRGQVFALLVMARQAAAPEGEITVGTDNAVNVDPNQKNIHYYLAPPASVAATLETRVDSTVREIYRMGRVEFARAQGASVASGVARAYEFQQTNRAIADFAGELARWENRVGWLVGRKIGISDERLSKWRTQPPASFDIEDLQSELKAALDAITVKLGPTAEREMRKSLVQRMLPGLPRETYEQIETELDQMAEREAQMAAAGVELAQAAGAGLEDEGDLDDEDDADQDRGADGTQADRSARGASAADRQGRGAAPTR